MDNRDLACNYLSKEMIITPENCRLGLDYHVKHHIWDRQAQLNAEGVKTMIRVYGEINNLKEPLPQPAKYMDQSYLGQALDQLRSN